MPINLYIFDLDGTLCERDKTDLRPKVARTLSTLANAEAKFAIATNQGGVGLRYWMEKAKFGEPEKYPTAETVIARLGIVLVQVEALTGQPWGLFFCFAYFTKTGKRGLLPNSSAPEWSFWHRKPNPGMLNAAIQWANVQPAQALMIGDRDDDMHAAKAAKCAFQFEGDFWR